MSSALLPQPWEVVRGSSKRRDVTGCLQTRRNRDNKSHNRNPRQVGKGGDETIQLVTTSVKKLRTRHREEARGTAERRRRIPACCTRGTTGRASASPFRTPRVEVPEKRASISTFVRIALGLTVPEKSSGHRQTQVQQSRHTLFGRSGMWDFPRVAQFFGRKHKHIEQGRVSVFLPLS